MRQTDLACANCGQRVREADAKDRGCRYWSDGIDLHLFCPRCAAREFARDAAASTDA